MGWGRLLTLPLFPESGPKKGASVRHQMARGSADPRAALLRRGPEVFFRERARPFLRRLTRPNFCPARWVFSPRICFHFCSECFLLGMFFSIVFCPFRTCDDAHARRFVGAGAPPGPSNVSRRLPPNSVLWGHLFGLERHRLGGRPWAPDPPFSLGREALSKVPRP